MTDDLSQPATAAEPEKPSARPTMTQTRPTLRDLFTGGWNQPQAALPTGLGRPLARLGAATRTTWHRWTSGGSTQQ